MRLMLGAAMCLDRGTSCDRQAVTRPATPAQRWPLRPHCTWPRYDGLRCL